MDSLSIKVKITPFKGLIADVENQKALYKELNEKLGSSFSSKNLSFKYDENMSYYQIQFFLQKNEIDDNLYSGIIACVLNRYISGDIVEFQYIDKSMIKDRSLYFLIPKYWIPLLLISLLTGLCFAFKCCNSICTSKSNIANKETVIGFHKDSIMIKQSK